MQVKNLISMLQTLDPEMRVKTWDAYHDEETYDVKLSIDETRNELFIMDMIIGREVNDNQVS